MASTQKVLPIYVHSSAYAPNAMPDPYLKEIAVVTKAYGVTTYVVMPESTHRTKVKELQAIGIVVEFSKGGSCHKEDALAKITAFQFLSHDEAPKIHGYGTIALELEDELRSVLETGSTLQSRQVGKLDAVIAFMGDGSELCGICMAFQRTRTRVFGAEVVSGKGDAVRKGDTHALKKSGGSCNATHRVLDDSAAHCLGLFSRPRICYQLFFTLISNLHT